MSKLQNKFDSMVKKKEEKARRKEATAGIVKGGKRTKYKFINKPFWITVRVLGILTGCLAIVFFAIYIPTATNVSRSEKIRKEGTGQSEAIQLPIIQQDDDTLPPILRHYADKTTTDTVSDDILFTKPSEYGLIESSNENTQQVPELVYKNLYDTDEWNPVTSGNDPLGNLVHDTFQNILSGGKRKEPNIDAGEQCEIHAIDVGQGNAILIQTYASNILIDTGDYEHKDMLFGALKLYGATSIKLLLLTHGDADHIGNAMSVLEQIPTYAMMIPNIKKDTPTYNNLIGYAQQKGVMILAPEPADCYIIDDMFLEILTPDATALALDMQAAASAGEEFDHNEASIGTILTDSTGQFRFLQYGDGEKSIERQLIDTHMIGGIDVLYVAHHGSNSSTGSALLEAIRGGEDPDAIISVGIDNEYGHPEHKVLDRLAQEGFDIYRTDSQGDISVDIYLDGTYSVTPSK